MNAAALPSDLLLALEELTSNPNPAPAALERVARWRRACGDAEAAATWQTWSLLPPEPQELRTALAALWRRLGDTDRAAQLLSGDGWPQLALLLQAGELEAAAHLQTRLLRQPPTLAISDLIELLELWKDSQRPQQALDLLQPLLAWMEQRGTPVSAQLCNAMADLLEQLQQFDAAEPWWQRSHTLQPHQAWPLMRLGHQALRRQQPAIAYHYASEVLSRDPGHVYAPRLQRKALVALNAERSLALLDGTPLERIPLPDAVSSPLVEPPADAFWEGCHRLALIGFDDATIVQGWITHLSGLMQMEETPREELQLWLIASPEPLWLSRQVQEWFRSEAPALADTLVVTSWPVWEPDRHGVADRVLTASDSAPFWRPAS